MSRLTACSVTALVALIAALSAPSIAVAQQATVAAINRGVVEIETSGAAGISVRIAEDLANLIDDGTTRHIVPVVGKGSLQSLTDLKYLRGVDMAILQTDVLDYAKEQRLLPGLESSLSYIPERGRLSRHAETAQAIDYMLKRWAAFTRFLDDGRICLTNNAAERALRGIALGRRARLFAGSDLGGERAAAMYTLIATAQLNDINPQA
jgi:hypothetical protein